jgi:nicotinamidase-related amidase
MTLPIETPGRTALLVVDVQNDAVWRGPYEVERILANIARLIAACRSAGVEVVHVQHDEPRGEPGAPGTDAWEIHESVRPESGEKVVRKRFNSAFRETGLLAHLQDRGIGTLVLVGIQTEYCVDTTCRVAFEHGFRVIMPEWTNTTFDNGDLSARQLHELYNRRIFADRFAETPTIEEAVREVERGG